MDHIKETIEEDAIEPRELLPFLERSRAFLILSLLKEYRDEPFRKMTLEDLENNCLSIEQVHHYALTLPLRRTLQLMVRSDSTELEPYMVCMQSDGIFDEGVEEDAAYLNSLFKKSLSA